MLCRPLMFCAHSYHVATPTFHQWRDPRHVYGLNFSKQEDAEVFATAAAAAIEELKALAADPVAAKIATSAQNAPLPRVCKTHELTFTHAAQPHPRSRMHELTHPPIHPPTRTLNIARRVRFTYSHDHVRTITYTRPARPLARTCTSTSHAPWHRCLTRCSSCRSEVLERVTADPDHRIPRRRSGGGGGR